MCIIYGTHYMSMRHVLYVNNMKCECVHITVACIDIYIEHVIGMQCYMYAFVCIKVHCNSYR